MYLKLSVRNALRSGRDYLIYTVTLTVLTAVMALSGMVSAVGGRAGYETASLPLLVTLIMVVLMRYVNRFILRQRAREFACYLLLGMGRRQLAGMFFLEAFLIGCACFAVGMPLGLGVGAWGIGLLLPGAATASAALGAAAETGGYFLVISVFSLLGTGGMVRRLEVRELMQEERRNLSQGRGSGRGWAAVAGASALVLAALLAGIALLPDGSGDMLVSLVSLPLLTLAVTFYRAAYALGNARRRAGRLPAGDRLYLMGQYLAGGASGALMNSVLFLCLAFCAAAFLFGGVMLMPGHTWMEPGTQRWMGFLQLCVCVIFGVLYFTVLSLRRVVEVQRERRGIRILRRLGKSEGQIRLLLARQVGLTFSSPLVLFLPLLAAAVPLVGYKLGDPLLLWRLCGVFLAGFAILYGAYGWLVLQMSARAVREP